MIARLGNVFYWMALLGTIACFGFGTYFYYDNAPTVDSYTKRYSWEAELTWDQFKNKKDESRRSQLFAVLLTGLGLSVAGKAIQYVLGGEWELNEFLDNLERR